MKLKLDVYDVINNALSNWQRHNEEYYSKQEHDVYNGIQDGRYTDYTLKLETDEQEGDVFLIFDFEEN